MLSQYFLLVFATHILVKIKQTNLFTKQVVKEKEEPGTSESVREKKKARNESAATYLVCFVVVIKICRIV